MTIRIGVNKCRAKGCENLVDLGAYCNKNCQRADLTNKVIYKDDQVEIRHWFYPKHKLMVIVYGFNHKEQARFMVSFETFTAMWRAITNSHQTLNVGHLMTDVTPCEINQPCGDCNDCMVDDDEGCYCDSGRCTCMDEWGVDVR